MADILHFNDAGVDNAVNDAIIACSEFPMAFPFAVESIARRWIVYEPVQYHFKFSANLWCYLSDIA